MFFVGDTTLSQIKQKLKGEFVEIDGERFYKISNVGEMEPFFISMVSAFISV